MADSSSEPRAKRQRVDKGRAAALEKLKKLKGSKHKYDVEEEVDSVYEIVDEREYAKKAKEIYGYDWIEDDGNDMGYAEDGRDFFEDEDEFSDEDLERKSPKENKKGAGNKKRLRDSDKPVKGKGSIRNLFSNVVPKKPTAIKLEDDTVLADILGELEDKPISNGSVEEKSINGTKSINSTMASSSRKTEAALVRDYMKSFVENIKKKDKDNDAIEPNDDKLLESIMKSKCSEKLVSHNIKTEESEQSNENNTIKVENITLDKKSENGSEEELLLGEDKAISDMDFSCLQDDENPFNIELPKETHNLKSYENKTSSVKVNENLGKNAEDFTELLNNWENICQNNNFEEETQFQNSDSNEVTLSQSALKFWYWEAWEDANKLPGEVFLFGRTADGKSVSVRVANIERVLYLLPREYLLDPITKEPTKQKVTLADLYKEFDEKIATDLKLNSFRSRKVTKNFAYHSIGIDVPQVCDYMEVRYDGKQPSPNIKRKYNSIAYIFGSNTTSLETFLLERKIKGPCWLTLREFKLNSPPLSWCKMDISISSPKNITLSDDSKPPPPPPLTLITLNVRTSLNPKTLKNEIVMISMLAHNSFNIDKPAPQPPFNRHMCGLTRPLTVIWPLDLSNRLTTFKSTRLFKHDTERALLSWFLAQYQQIDADLIVTYDALDCQLDIITDRIIANKIPQWSRLGRLRVSTPFSKKLLDFFIGRMICDVKRSAEECIRSRSYDLQTLSQNVLRIKENERMDVNEEDLLEMYETGDGILKLISLTMQDSSYILRIMYELNIMPLALQITNICGNTMTRTLQSGRSERNESLLLHAFTEKNFIVPDKKKRDWSTTSALNPADEYGADGDARTSTTVSGARKKAAYSGGLVLEPIRGLYDKYILLMDFNSLYPSIIQEYNICFTTVQQPYNPEDLPTLPDPSTPQEQGILPQQLRRLVDSRREVKKLMAAPDLSPELQMQYHIRQMALKLTANSMYGCLGFPHSRFFGQHLAALVTHKGREILQNTRSLVEKLRYDVVYGDTDSIMVNTNITDYDQVFKIGNSIKQNVNKVYKQLELDIDGVFSCLLLLKKKKYAAVKVYKNAKGELIKEQEHKGLDIVRRDWSQIAIMVGKIVLDEILSEKQLDEKLDAVHSHLEHIKTQIQEDDVPLPMFLITKQLSKAPGEYKNSSATQPQVQVALRMNTTRNRRYKRGDMVDFVICEDGTTNPSTQRAYHLDELKSNPDLKLDKNYYLAHQIHPVVTRLVEVLEGTDASRIAECLGLDPSKFKAAVQRTHEERLEDTVGETFIKTSQQKYRLCEKFKFICITCKTENIIASAFKPTGSRSYEAVLENCGNSECSTSPYQYIVSIRNQLILTMRRCIKRFYQNWFVCDNPACNQNVRSLTHVTSGNRPICHYCKNGALVRQYSERDLYTQLCYFQYMFDLSKYQHKNITLSSEAEVAYNVLRETVDQQLAKSGYSTISLAKLFAHFKSLEKSDEVVHSKIDVYAVSAAITLEEY